MRGNFCLYPQRNFRKKNQGKYVINNNLFITICIKTKTAENTS